MNPGVITGRDGEAHMDSTIDKGRSPLIDCFSITRACVWKFYRAASKFLYAVQYVCRLLSRGCWLPFRDAFLRELGMWKEICLNITVFWHVPPYAWYKFTDVSRRRIAETSDSHCHEKIKYREQQTFSLLQKSRKSRNLWLYAIIWPAVYKAPVFIHNRLSKR
jgi:hypothetical protein